MHDFLLFAGFVLLPLILAAVSFRFLRRNRRIQNTTTRSLLVGNMLVFLFLSSLVLLIGECYYRFVFDTTDSFGLMKTSQRWFERHFHQNKMGLRDSIEYSTSRLPNTQRITFLGDSFTAGHGITDVEDRFVNLIRRDHVDLDIHAVARCGWDTGHEIMNWNYLLDRGYECDLVVLVYCLNDISDIMPEWPKIIKRINQESKPGYFVEHSYLINTYYFRLRAARDPDINDYYGFLRSGYQGAVWEKQKQRLTSIRDRIEAEGGKLVVVTFPFLHALSRYDEYSKFHEKLDEFWHENNVPHLDLLSTYQSHEPSALVVNSRDAHPNERAHKLAAKAIDAFLKQNGMN